jgi:hypothetical protein
MTKKLPSNQKNLATKRPMKLKMVKEIPMKKSTIRRSRKMAAVFSFLSVFAATSMWATVVTWDLNPNGTEGHAGSTSQTFVSSGYSITANGYTVGLRSHTPLGLYYKNQGSDETGLGIVGPADHELQGNGSYPMQFIQFDVNSILAEGFTDAKLQIGSVQGSPDDTFVIWGSSALGDPGAQIGGVYDSASDMAFVSIADFTNYKFISIRALSGDVLPVAFQAMLAPIPEMGALFPVIGLIVAVAITQILRRRRIAQLRAGSPGGH